VVQFIILDARHHITPTLFCKTKFDFTFLTNWIRFIDTIEYKPCIECFADNRGEIYLEFLRNSQ
jgi:hypothetical protein